MISIYIKHPFSSVVAYTKEANTKTFICDKYVEQCLNFIEVRFLGAEWFPVVFKRFRQSQ